jgi:plasmid maintenance system antidote protein VapI
MKTRDYLIQIQKKYGVDGNIAGTARLMGVSRKTVYSWLDGELAFGEDNAIKAADLLGLDADEVVINIRMEGTQSAQARAAWESILHRIGGHAAGIMLAVVVSFLYLAPSSPGYASYQEPGTLYYVKLAILQPTTMIAAVMLLVSLGMVLHARSIYHKADL